MISKNISWARRLVFVILLFTLVACQAGQNGKLVGWLERQTETPSIPPTMTNLPVSATPSKTLAPTQTATASLTPTPIRTATFVPPQSFDVSTIKTITPAMAAQCPTSNPDLPFDVTRGIIFFSDSRSSNREPNYDFDYVLEYLNNGGTINSLTLSYYKEFNQEIGYTINIKDVTGDQNPEIILRNIGGIGIIGCKDGKYYMTSYIQDDLFGAWYRDAVTLRDLNNNGLPDIILHSDPCGFGDCPYYQIYEWNGNVFQQLTIQPCEGISAYPVETEYKDIDSNGTIEMIFSYNGKSKPIDIFGFPYRQRVLTCMWNGQNFVVYSDQYEAPFYRLQAVRDADREVKYQHYDMGIKLYQQAIDDKKLEWYSDDRNVIAYGKYFAEYYNYPDVGIAIPNDVQQDPNEYPNLAAYSYFRIVLIRLLQGDMIAAQDTFMKAEQAYPIDQTGGQFIQMAKILLEGYQSTEEIGQACQGVREYAIENQDSLNELLHFFEMESWAGYTSFEQSCPYK